MLAFGDGTFEGGGIFVGFGRCHGWLAHGKLSRCHQKVLNNWGETKNPTFSSPLHFPPKLRGPFGRGKVCALPWDGPVQNFLTNQKFIAKIMVTLQIGIGIGMSEDRSAPAALPKILTFFGKFLAWLIRIF
jgi:hypothetical protein